jgi:Putative binding domain, N-terminal
MRLDGIKRRGLARNQSGASGSGTGTVKVSIQENAADARSGTATIAGQTFTVNQASGCSFVLGSMSQTVGRPGAR